MIMLMADDDDDDDDDDDGFGLAGEQERLSTSPTSALPAKTGGQG